MNIAVIAWGSLVWCPGSLLIKTRWRADGPRLPIEFARISGDGRLTLVIHPGIAVQQTYWALSGCSEIGAARANLMEREACDDIQSIHYFPLHNDSPKIPREVEVELGDWLPRLGKIDAAIWTGLRTNWSEKFPGVAFSPDEAVYYLEKLEALGRQKNATYRRAREYVRNAPPSIQTEVRARMREKGWTDAKLSEVLFDFAGQE